MGTNCDLKMSQIKMYSDGLLDSYTAAMLEPYSTRLPGPQVPKLRANKGMNYFTPQRMQNYMRELQYFTDENGNEGHFDFNVHAIGDRGVSETLDAINGSYDEHVSDRRHRITHVEITDPKDWDRFHKLAAIADFQTAGYFVPPDPENENMRKELIGDRKKYFLSINAIRERNGFTTLNSDWDVSPLNPFIGIEHAATRNYQSVSVKNAIEMYTINPAFAMRQENKVGSLVVGKEADFIIIDQNILKIPMHKISDTNVLQTVFKGNAVYTSGQFSRHVADVTEKMYTTLFR